MGEQLLMEKPNAAPVESNAPLTMAQMLAFFQKMMETNAAQTQEILKTVVAEIRKPPVDPVREAQKLREKATKEAGEKEMWEKKARMKLRCTHLREDGSCVVAWATQSDGKERGVCPNCGSTFTPEDQGDELELYNQIRKLPRGRKESVRYVS
jgi:Zn finger protein HypA/HybF involved in hydrogenase expression